MTKKLGCLSAVLALFLGACSGCAHAQKVSIQNGNVCIGTGGETKRLTSFGHDSELVLARDSKWIVFIRTMPGRKISSGSEGAKETQLWQIRADGKEPSC